MKRRVLDAKQVGELVERLSDDIARRNRKARKLALVGVKRRGVPLAERIASRLRKKGWEDLPVGAVDITLYRDDLKLVAETPIVRGSELGFDINGRTLVLVDDVVFTGRTVRAALSVLLDFGRPNGIQLAVLVDRGNRELPIAPDFAGETMETGPKDLVDICLEEEDGEDAVYLTRK